jgi:hypothetical protein
MNSLRCSALRSGALSLSLALSQMLILAPSMVQAAEDSVRLAGQLVFTTNASSGGMTPDQRAAAIQRNLDNALVAANDRTPNSVNIVYVKGVPVITLGGYQVVTVSGADAKDAATTPAVLAQRWANALRGSLKDQASVSSYVAQLNGVGGGAGIPQTDNGAPPGATAYNPPPGGGADASQGGPDQFGRNTPPPGGMPPGGPGYGGGSYQGNAYGGQAGGGAYQGSAYGNGGYPPPGAGYPPPGAGYPPPGEGYPPPGYAGGGYPMQRGRLVYAPSGLVLPVSLKTSISTQAASPGDLIEASLNDAVATDSASIPPGSVLIGQVGAAKAGGFLGRSGMLEVKFNRLRTPDGQEVPITSHIVGGIGKYTLKGGDTAEGETWKNKVGQAALRGAIGAGAGAALGTAVGAIAGAGVRRPWFQGGGTFAGNGAGTGAWSGAAIGGGVGVADSLLLRKGKDVTIKSGTPMQIQLDSPITVAAGGSPPPTSYGY